VVELRARGKASAAVSLLYEAERAGTNPFSLNLMVDQTFYPVASGLCGLIEALRGVLCELGCSQATSAQFKDLDHEQGFATILQNARRFIIIARIQLL
jgi:hypothetical protein